MDYKSHSLSQTLLIVLLIFGGICIMPYLFGVTGAFSIFYDNPPKPKIKYGEFPFRIEYSVNGETKIIEDIVICEYTGVKSSGTAGKRNTWKKYLKSGMEEVVLFYEENDTESYKITLNIGRPEYYMDDSKYYKEFYEQELLIDNLLLTKVIKKAFKDTSTSRTISQEESMQMYGLEIISMNFSEPIDNLFY